MVKLHFYMDPEHGWVKTTMETLEKYGISEKISIYSYREGNIVYLEEDCDATLLVKTMKAHGVEVEFVEHHRNSRSPIRYKQPYSCGGHTRPLVF